MDAHAVAPATVRAVYKHCHKLPLAAIQTPILDPRDASSLRPVNEIAPDALAAVYSDFLSRPVQPAELLPATVYEHPSVPGTIRIPHYVPIRLRFPSTLPRLFRIPLHHITVTPTMHYSYMLTTATTLRTTGLRIVPSLLPVAVQDALLSKLLLRDLSNPDHLTNVHLHYNLPPPPSQSSFFDLPPDTEYSPKDPALHKPLSLSLLLARKLRWMTLGGQYDWSTKQYPDGPPVPFPRDIRNLVHGIFPSIEPQAAICNTYSPGDTLSAHRDVSEEADKDLVSISIGCDALFLISLSPSNPPSDPLFDPPSENPVEEPAQVNPAQENPDGKAAEDNIDGKPTQENTDVTNSNEKNANGKNANGKNVDEKKHRRKKGKTVQPPPAPPLDQHTLVLRIRSGDALIMGGPSRWAWHAVPKVIPDTCPPELANWPASPPDEGHKIHQGEGHKNERDGKDEWAGWLKHKRVNLNLRQMYNHTRAGAPSD
ncbi:hypothetical protein DRE_04328 [Drechslerella stenobrocha 248]|uniref:Alpha-ketoglutarate-dependent dioxygenase AlkB-like domain-containing protein n=1 Tax=Drechslerella stenobrocha 248 TaxID=1043628 RepID=W7IBA9_9PEZI|nr:hypothetical protein DRE_04328 [Drechslerella stenobrocha 248]